MNPRLIAEIAAGIGVVATIMWIVLGLKGLKVLREISESPSSKAEFQLRLLILWAKGIILRSPNLNLGRSTRATRGSLTRWGAGLKMRGNEESH